MKTGWAELTALRKTHPAQVMLWEAAPNRAIADQLKTQGIRGVVFAPCANRPNSDGLAGDDAGECGCVAIGTGD